MAITLSKLVEFIAVEEYDGYPLFISWEEYKQQIKNWVLANKTKDLDEELIEVNLSLEVSIDV